MVTGLLDRITRLKAFFVVVSSLFRRSSVCRFRLLDTYAGVVVDGSREQAETSALARVVRFREPASMTSMSTWSWSPGGMPLPTTARFWKGLCGHATYLLKPYNYLGPQEA